MNSKAKEPLFHIVKRDALPWQRGLRIRLLAILLALVVCGILTTIFTGINPVQVYVSIFMGASEPPERPGLPSRMWRFCF